MESGLALFFAVLLVGIATALGIKLLAAFGLNTRVEAFLYGAGLGLGILAYLTST